MIKPSKLDRDRFFVFWLLSFCGYALGKVTWDLLSMAVSWFKGTPVSLP